MEDILSDSRKKNIAEARQTAMHMVRDLTKMSTPDIAAEFRKKDHTTVLYSLNKVEDALADPNHELHSIIRDINANINGKL